MGLFSFIPSSHSHLILQVPHDTKLSKLDTLRLATSYILHLTQILDNDELPVQTMTTPPTTIQAPNNFVSILPGFSEEDD